MTIYSYFHRVADAAFANPFSDHRDALDRELALAAGDDRDRQPPLEAALEELRRRRSAIPAHVADIPEEHRQAVELSAIYALFHDYIDEFDRLIDTQQSEGATPVAVPFGKRLLAELVGAGFTEMRAHRILGVLWQIRRAYAFLSRALPGEAACMRHVRVRLWQNIFTHDMALYEQHLWKRLEDFSLFLLGETGTGKGTAAGAIAQSGWIPWDPARGRFAHSFTDAYVPINLSQFPESLIESELFGHAKGAFTGANRAYAGAFQRGRDHSTIFLDEIGEVSVPVQVKLLRVLQERLFSPVGSHAAHRFNGRVVAATNVTLDELRSPGRLREDFYFRLSSDVIEMPPLRLRLQEHPQERDALVAHILARIIGHEGEGDVSLLRRVLHSLDAVPDAYAWPGNVRELEQAIRRILLTGSYSPPSTTPLQTTAFDELPRQLHAGELRVTELVTRYCRHLYDQHGTFEAVARVTGLDRRTVKRYLA